MGKICFSSSKQKTFQILLCLHENWLTYQINGADFNYEVENSVNRYEVAPLVPQQHCRRNVMTYSSYLLIDIRNGKPFTYLLSLPSFITLSLLFITV